MNIVNVGYDSTHYYVLADSRPRLLVDAGWPGTMGKFQHACKRAGVEIAALKHVFITHFHPDHAGLVHELIRGGARLIVLENQTDSAAAFGQYMKPEHGYVEIDLKRCDVLAFAASRSYLAGLGIAGEIIPTPGHSDDSVTLILDSGEAFTGDLTHPSMADETGQQSWAAIRAHGGTAVYPGHGPVPQPLR